MSVCVCVRERESVCVCERERECVCVCERERESVCVCVTFCYLELLLSAEIRLEQIE